MVFIFLIVAIICIIIFYEYRHRNYYHMLMASKELLSKNSETMQVSFEEITKLREEIESLKKI